MLTFRKSEEAHGQRKIGNSCFRYLADKQSLFSNETVIPVYNLKLSSTHMCVMVKTRLRADSEGADWGDYLL